MIFCFKFLSLFSRILSRAAFAKTIPSDSSEMNLFNLVGIFPLISLKDISFKSNGTALFKKALILYDLRGDDEDIFINLFFLIESILFFFTKRTSLISARGRVPTTEVPFSSFIGKSFQE